VITNQSGPAESTSVDADDVDSVDVVIVGAGFAGLYMLYKYHDLGLRGHVFGVGGTWY
jgi:cyclohexanone monooxygenase